MSQFIDTYSNLKKAEPIFYRKDGRLTAYALHCGYVERFPGLADRYVSLYHEHSTYHVIYINTKTKYRDWQSFETVNEAWTCFNHFKQLINSNSK